MPENDQIAVGTYEVLRHRLHEAASDLRERFKNLNKARSDVFGNIETRLIATTHVTTSNNCIPRDLTAIHDSLLLGFNVQFGLRTEITPPDVFASFNVSDDHAHEMTLAGLSTPQFLRDFEELYRYYKAATFSRFYQNGLLLYMVFQVGKTIDDIKAFKWSLDTQDIKYVDNRSAAEVRYPPQTAFEWRKVTRDQHRAGIHPHISINDIVFVECIGGDLTIKIEDNTASGSGIYAEPVDNPDQTLDDAEISYCEIGNLVLLKIRPYQEQQYRYFVYSVKQRSVIRLDAIASGCVLLPDDHGVIFPRGYVLQTGTHRSFDHGYENLRYDRTIAAPNGEDYLYLFFDPQSGTYVQLRYNLIRQDVDTPLICHGQAFYDDGRMITIRASDQPAKHHAAQIWQTPFVSANYQMDVETDSLLYKIGNRELVRAMAECQELLQVIDKDEAYADLYADLQKRATDLLDGYFWIDREETCQLAIPLRQVRSAAEAAIEEYQKVTRVRQETQLAFQDVSQKTQEACTKVERERFDSVEAFVASLTLLRTLRGEIISLRERKYIDLDAVAELEKKVIEANERLGRRTVDFLLADASLKPYVDKIQAASQQAAHIAGGKEGRELQKVLEGIHADLNLLVETVSQLKIDDVTQRTKIVDPIGDLFGTLNQVRAQLAKRTKELLSVEMESDFASQTKLLDQSVAATIDSASTPQQVDESLAGMILQIEELESRFAEFDELITRLEIKRNEVITAFDSKRAALVEQRTQKAERISAAAGRILESIASRTLRVGNEREMQSFLAADPMVAKVRQLAEQLQALGDSVRMEDVLTRLKTIGDDAVRQLRDRRDLLIGGGETIRFGKHAFNVNRQPLELTILIRDGELHVHMTGTQFYEKLSHPKLEEARDLWLQPLRSESENVYRAEFLAYQLYDTLVRKGENLPQASLDSAISLEKYIALSSEDQVRNIREIMQARHSEGYQRGVHDLDAVKILNALISMHEELGLLRYHPEVRGRADYAWFDAVPVEDRKPIERWINSHRRVTDILERTPQTEHYPKEIAGLLEKYAIGLIPAPIRLECANYLFHRLFHYGSENLDRGEEATYRPLNSRVAVRLADRVSDHLPSDEYAALQVAIATAHEHPYRSWVTALAAVDGFLAEVKWNQQETIEDPMDYRCEVTALMLLNPDQKTGPLNQAAASQPINGLLGEHARIVDGQLNLQYHEFVNRLERYCASELPRFDHYVRTKAEILVQKSHEFGIEDFRSKVLTSFVRNQLIDSVYLPIIGDNLAKQMGTAGESKRTDRMGLLLLVSPPGYGKTTLMEYVANRLGLVFVKVNGPAIGHAVTSIDPAEARNAAARDEVERINLALEMGDNVMLYLDDIQHCNTELLQKFISLCDGTRRMEGVWHGSAKTYDLRGRKFVVVMAGNPYTESGDRFQIPDMLANRADIYNLGEMIGNAQEVFELSYLENALTSNSVLLPLSRSTVADQQLVYNTVTKNLEQPLDLESNIGPDQLRDILAILKKMIVVRDIVLKVNRQYIYSAAQNDAYRIEPPFKLQGSYRNMNRIAEKIMPIMNDDELTSVILATYEQDVQTLTRDAEANWLKFKELLGLLTPEDQKRWEEIKYAYVENNKMSGIQGDDRAAQVIKSMVGLRDGLESIRKTLAEGIRLGQEHDQSGS
jgi:hypothetical protein